MSDDGEGAAIREFSFVFETMSEITKAWKKDVQDSRFIKFLLHAGRARALDLFHRLDKGMTCGLDERNSFTCKAAYSSTRVYVYIIYIRIRYTNTFVHKHTYKSIW